MHNPPQPLVISGDGALPGPPGRAAWTSYNVWRLRTFPRSEPELGMLRGELGERPPVGRSPAADGDRDQRCDLRDAVILSAVDPDAESARSVGAGEDAEPRARPRRTDPRRPGVGRVAA